jgi:hypothetical protein
MYFDISIKKSYFGTEIISTKNDNIPILYALFQELNDTPYIDIRLGLVVQPDFETLNKDYDFVDYNNNYPVFMKKDFINRLNPI